MSSTTQERMAEMFSIQNGLNTKSYDQTWLEKGKTGEFDYALAAGQELAEFFNSLPFDWWTGSQEDRLNCVTELVDAWHFIMSQAIIHADGDLDVSIESALIAFEDSDDVAQPACPKLEVIGYAKDLVVSLYTAKNPGKYLKDFFNLCAAYGVSFDLLYARYVAKATLNKFRVENGYKKKMYAKVWDFGTVNFNMMEDNFYLSTWIHSQIDAGVIPAQDAIHAWLTDTYSGVINKPKAEAAA